jgi:2-succinyl-6-hydroxy-2,4-cyclohexadiene-1-carboxylate synthase
MWVRQHGDPPAAVVALHGFTLHGGSFRSFAAELDETVAAPDLPGHGQTEIQPISVETATSAVATLLAQSVTPPVLLGYSQGGRIALQIALAHPELISGLVLVSTAMGLADGDRRVREVADDALATRIERIGTERFINEWLANPITATYRVAASARNADRRIRLENKASGLAEALRGMGQAAVPDLRARMPHLEVLACFIAGHLDPHYSQIASEMSALTGQHAVIVPGVGHNVILEKPAAVASAVRKLLTPRNG